MKVIIPAAGLGTRLLPATKEQPKEMLPIFAEGASGKLCTKPLLQLVFEQLYDTGFRGFCFIVGRGKRIIEDHFTPDRRFAELMREKGKEQLALELDSFYEMLENSTIVWVNQPEPKGFGDAVLKARHFADGDRILVHAGDTFVVSENNDHLRRLMKVHERFSPEATLILQEVDDPRMYGVAEVKKVPDKGIYKIRRAVEKPEEPPSNLAIMPIYVFEFSIFRALKETPFGKGGELQLTDGFQKLIKKGLDVLAIKLKPNEIRWDIGTSDTYWKALEKSYRCTRKV